MLCIFMSIPAFAGELEDALKSKDYVFLYLYTPECGYCKKFNPNYDKISKSYANKYKFVKINANTNYGYGLVRKYRAMYVPYTVIINSKTSKVYQIQSACLLDMNCMNKALTDFNK